MRYRSFAVVDDGSCLVGGCQDSRLAAYSPTADYNDGSCPQVVEGCTVSAAPNYRPLANVDDGSCRVVGCTNPVATNYNPVATTNGTCTGLKRGCADSTASNFDAAATIAVPADCVYLGCTDPTATNFDPRATDDDGSCAPHFPGCTEPAAANYHADYTKDDGSCSYGGCLDPADPNFSLSVTYALPGACANSGRRQRRRGQTAGTGAAPDDANADVNGTTDAGTGAGCMDPRATSFNPVATAHDASLCSYEAHGCTNASAVNYLLTAVTDDGSCVAPRLGCMVTRALNFDSLATVPAASSGCALPLVGCMNAAAVNCALTPPAMIPL